MGYSKFHQFLEEGGREGGVLYSKFRQFLREGRREGASNSRRISPIGFVNF